MGEELADVQPEKEPDDSDLGGEEISFDEYLGDEEE